MSTPLDKPVVVLDRIEPGEPEPAYCVHGRCTCIACDEWCWLGDQTFPVVQSGQVLPLCQPCATRLITPQTPTVGNLKDSRRQEPH